MQLTQIDQYEVMYSANAFPPRIWLKHAGEYIGQLIFAPDGSKLPADSMVGNFVNLHYYLEDFENTIDLLRNETPTYLLYSGAGPGFENGIKTAANVAKLVAETEVAAPVSAPMTGRPNAAHITNTM